jgi:hypothetical protein
MDFLATTLFKNCGWQAVTMTPHLAENFYQNGLTQFVKAEWSPTLDENVFYVASVDVARSSARTIVEIFKVRRGTEFFTKKLVNIIPMEGRNFLYQAAKIKELDATFNFDAIVIDTNGLGVGLVDILMAPTVDTNGIEHGAWNIINIKQYSKQFERDQTIGATPKIFVIKTNQHSAGKSYCPYTFFPVDGRGRRLAC